MPYDASAPITTSDPDLPLTQAERAELQRLRGLADSFDDIVFTLDTDQRHTAVYGRWVARGGLTLEFFLGKTSADIFGAEVAAVHTAANRRALAGEDVLYEWTAPAADGVAYFETRVTPLYDAAGNIIGISGVGRDKTAERRQEQERLQVLERYRAVVEASPLAVFVLDAAGRVLQWNPGAEHIFGWTAQEMIGQRPLYLDAEAEADFNANVAFCLAGNMHRGKEIRRRHRDGHLIYFSTASAPIHDNTGQIVGVMVILDDITERKQAEAQLRLWELISHKAGWAIVLVDHATNRVVMANPAAYALYGYPPEELIGKDIIDLHAPEVLADFYETREPLSRTGELRHETTHVRRDGSRFLADITVTLHRDTDGNVLYHIANIRDITAERRQEQERLQVLERYRAVVNASPLAIYVLDAQSRVIQWNPSAERILGWTAAEVIGKTPPYVDAGSLADFQENAARGLAGYVHTNKELRRRHKDGHELYLSGSSAPLRDGQGNIVALMVILDDVTQRKQNEDQLRLWELTFRDAGWGVAVIDIQSDRIVTANPAAHAIYGYDDLTGVSVTDLVAPDMRPGLAARLAAVHAEGHARYVSYNLRQDGTRFPIEVTASVHRDADGAPRYRIVSLQDLSEQRRLETEHLRALHRFEALFEASPLAIHVLSPEGRIELWNPGAERIFGWTAEEVIGAPPPFVDDAARPAFQESLARSLAGETVFGKEIRRRHKDGHWLDLSITGAPFYDETGSSLGIMVVVEDISERKAAEAQLRLWEMIFREAGWGVLVTDATATHILAANPAAAAMYGYRHDEMTEVNVADLFAPTDRERLLTELDYVLAHNYVRYISIHTRRDGGQFPVELDVSVYRGPDGRPLYLLANVQDLSARRRIEAERLEALQRFQTVFDSAPLAIEVLDVDGRVELWSPGAERVFGWKAEEVVGRLLPYVDAENIAAFRASLSYTLAGNTIIGREIRRRHKDGHFLDLNLITAPLHDQEGHITGLLAILEDISERRRMETERLEVLQRFEAVVKSSPLGIVMIDGAGIVQLWNPGAERMLGWTEDEVIGHQLPYLDATSEPELRRNLAQVMAGHSLPSLVLRRRRKDGRPIDISAASAPIRDGEGRIVASLSNFEDITERKANEEQLRLWEMIFREAGWAVLMADAQTNRLVTANPAALTMYGYTREEFIGIPMIELFAPEVRHESPSRIARVHQTDYERYTSYHIRKDGTRFPVDVNVSAHRDDAGNVRYRIANVQDLSERRRMEADRLEALERFRAVFDSSPLAIMVVGGGGRVELWNRGAEQILGYTAEEALGNLPPHIDAEMLPEFRRFCARTLAGQMLAGQWVRRRRKDGVLIDLSLSTAPLHNRQGQAAGALFILEDITERRRLEQERADALERFRANFDSSPLAIAVMSTTGQVRMWNASAERIFGWTAAEVIGKTPLEIGMLEEPEIAWRMTDILAGNIHAGREVRRRCKDGHTLDVSLSTAPLRDAQGDVTGILVMFEDISARKAAEAQLRQATERLHGLHAIDQAIIQAHSPQAIAASAVAHLRRLVGASRASVVLVEHGAQEAVFLVVDTTGPTSWGTGRRVPFTSAWLQRLLHPPANPVANLTEEMLTSEFLRAMYAEGERSIFSVPLWAGDHLVGALTLSSRRADGFTPAHIEIVEEVAAELVIALQQARLVEEVQRYAVELEERVAARTRELEAANLRLQEVARLKDEFLANMSHELRTPLTGVLNLAEAMGEGAFGPLTAAQTRTIGTIVESGQHLADLISDLLDISRIEAGRLKLEMQPCNLRDVCASSLRVVQPIAQKQHQNLTFECAQESFVIIADARRVKQMLLNLLSNAIKFTPEEGRITLRLSAHPDGHEVYLAVQDTGVGIRAEDMPKLFLPFSRLDSALVRRVPGTGLGLALVKRMVTLHGGAIEVESQPESGSCFRLILPAKPPAGPEDAAPRVVLPPPPA